MIPAKHLGGLPVPPAMDITGRGTLPPLALPTTVTAGLQVPMAATSGFSQTIPPKPAPPPAAVEGDASDRSAGRLLSVLGLVCVGILGAALGRHG